MLRYKNNLIDLSKFMMVAPKTSVEIQIHGVLFKGTLPAKLHNAINAQSRSFNLKDKDWSISMFIYKNKGYGHYLKERWNEIFPFIVSAPCKELILCKNE
jgi:hypothetical protein